MTAQPSQQGQRKTQEPKQSEHREAGQPQGQETGQRAQNAPSQPQANQTEQSQATSQQAQNAPSQPEPSQPAPQQGGGPEQREQGEANLARRDGGQGGRVTRHRREFAEVFDPQRAIRVGLLRLARNWQRNGSTYQAIYAYTQVLIRYPDTGAAHAAVEELLELAETLEQQGRFHAALNIFNQLEQLT